MQVLCVENYVPYQKCTGECWGCGRVVPKLIIFIRFDKFVVWILFDILLLYLVGNTIKTVLIKFPKFRDCKRFWRILWRTVLWRQCFARNLYRFDCAATVATLWLRVTFFPVRSSLFRWLNNLRNDSCLEEMNEKKDNTFQSQNLTRKLNFSFFSCL